MKRGRWKQLESIALREARSSQLGVRTLPVGDWTILRQLRATLRGGVPWKGQPLLATATAAGKVVFVANCSSRNDVVANKVRL